MGEDRKEEKAGWMSVPAFGEWEQYSGGVVPHYSADFSKVRENRRLNKSRVSIVVARDDEDDDDGDGQFFTINPTRAAPNSKSDPVGAVAGADRVAGGGVGDRLPILDRPIRRRRSRSPKRIKKIMSYLRCCGPLGA